VVGDVRVGGRAADRAAQAPAEPVRVDQPRRRRPRHGGVLMRAALLCALLALAASCSVTMDLPQDFLRLETTGDLKAVSGDDARIWVREFETPDEAPLAFWVEALRHDLVQQRGYDLIAE